MSITADKMAAWCRGILGDNPDVPKLTLEKYLAAIPRLDALAALPSGTPVLVRGDVDAKPGAKVGDGDIRLRSMKETLDYGRQKGWKQIVFGHVGREPEKSLAKVRDRLAEILGCEVTFIADWLDPATLTIKDEVADDDPAPPRRAASSCCKTRGSTTSSACSGRPSRPIARNWPSGWPSSPTSARRSSPRSTSTRPFRPAAWTPPAWWCRRPWTRWPWAATRPSSSTGR